jgi:RNA polymerase sigma factor FliA
VNTSLESPEALSIADVLPIVNAVVAQMSRHLPPHVSAQDLASAGKLALMEVLNDFNGSFARDRGYVVCRVRGAVLDEMRRLDPLSRYGRAQVRLVRRAVSELEAELSRAPTDAEVSRKTGLPVVEVAKISRLGVAAKALSSDCLDEVGDRIRSMPDLDSRSPADVAEDSDASSVIRNALARLTRSQSTVLLAYYFSELTLQEIATHMAISVVRVHQIKVAAEASLRGDVELKDAWAATRAFTL